MSKSGQGQTADMLVRLAQASVSSGKATQARSCSLRILCDQLDHTQSNLQLLQQELERLLDHDTNVKKVLAIPELGPMTVAVLRAALGDLDRFNHMDQVVAYAGLDLQVKQSGKWKGQTKLSKRGSGRLRRDLYLAALRSIRSPMSANVAIWHLLSPFAGTWHEKGHGRGCGHAQTLAGGCSPDAHAGEL